MISLFIVWEVFLVNVCKLLVRRKLAALYVFSKCYAMDPFLNILKLSVNTCL